MIEKRPLNARHYAFKNKNVGANIQMGGGGVWGQVATSSDHDAYLKIYIL